MLKSTMEVSPDLRAHWDAYLQEVRESRGLSENASPAELAELYREIRDQEVDKGFTITEKGERTYLTPEQMPSMGGRQKAAGSVSGGVSNLKTSLQNDPTGQKKQLFLWGGVMALTLIFAIGYLIFQNVDLPKRGSKAEATPTQSVAVTQAPQVDYSLIIESVDGDIKSRFDKPLSFSYKDTTFVLETSISQRVATAGQWWCDIDETDAPEIGCWLDQSLVNVVVGFQQSAFEKHFKNAAPGETIKVNFGQRQIVYRIKEGPQEVVFDDASAVFRTVEPRLTIVFFAPLNEDGDRVNTRTRYVVYAYPEQEEDDARNVHNNIVDGLEETQYFTYAGEMTPLEIGGKNAFVTQRVYNYGQAESQALKVIFDFTVEDNDLSLFENLQYQLDAFASYPPMEMGVNPVTGQSYRVTFVVSDNGMEQEYGLRLRDRDGDASVLKGRFSAPRPFQFVHIQHNQITAEYQHMSKTLVVHIPYTMDMDATAELCGNCQLVVTGQPVMPTLPITFSPTLGEIPNRADLVFTVTLNPNNMHDLQLKIGDSIYLLNQTVPAPTPDPLSVTPTPDPLALYLTPTPQP